MELRSIQDEEDHRDADSDDLDHQKDHDSVLGESAHVVKESCYESGQPCKHSGVDVVAVRAEKCVNQTLNNDEVNEIL